MPLFLKNSLMGFVLVCFSLNSLMVSGAQADVLFSSPVMIETGIFFQPARIRGMEIFTDEAFHFDFIVDAGDSGLDEKSLQEEAGRLIRYFYASLTIPEKDLWVNLNPNEPDRIVPEAFGQTDMGRDLLAQDYLLKQLTASLMNPEGEVGKKFWERVYERIYEKVSGVSGQESGNADSLSLIPDALSSFNKVWIVPDHADIYTQGRKVFITDAKLKVMMEGDYCGAVGAGPRACPDQGDHRGSPLRNDVQSIIRSTILPIIEDEVNNGKIFAPLRQIYHSLILASWLKTHLKESMNQNTYIDHNKILGIEIKDKNAKDEIYQRYLRAFTVGAADVIKEEYDPVTQNIIPRKYFVGGADLEHISMDAQPVAQARRAFKDAQTFRISTQAKQVGNNDAMLGDALSESEKEEEISSIVVAGNEGADAYHIEELFKDGKLTRITDNKFFEEEFKSSLDSFSHKMKFWGFDDFFSEKEFRDIQQMIEKIQARLDQGKLMFLSYPLSEAMDGQGNFLPMVLIQQGEEMYPVFIEDFFFRNALSSDVFSDNDADAIHRFLLFLMIFQMSGVKDPKSKAEKFLDGSIVGFYSVPIRKRFSKLEKFRRTQMRASKSQVLKSKAQAIYRHFKARPLGDFLSSYKASVFTKFPSTTADLLDHRISPKYPFRLFVTSEGKMYVNSDDIKAEDNRFLQDAIKNHNNILFYVLHSIIFIDLQPDILKVLEYVHPPAAKYWTELKDKDTRDQLFRDIIPERFDLSRQNQLREDTLRKNHFFFDLANGDMLTEATLRQNKDADLYVLYPVGEDVTFVDTRPADAWNHLRKGSWEETLKKYPSSDSLLISDAKDIKMDVGYIMADGKLLSRKEFQQAYPTMPKGLLWTWNDLNIAVFQSAAGIMEGLFSEGWLNDKEKYDQHLKYLNPQVFENVAELLDANGKPLDFLNDVTTVYYQTDFEQPYVPIPVNAFSMKSVITDFKSVDTTVYIPAFHALFVFKDQAKVLTAENLEAITRQAKVLNQELEQYLIVINQSLQIPSRFSALIKPIPKLISWDEAFKNLKDKQIGDGSTALKALLNVKPFLDSISSQRSKFPPMSLFFNLMELQQTRKMGFYLNIWDAHALKGAFKYYSQQYNSLYIQSMVIVLRNWYIYTEVLKMLDVNALVKEDPKFLDKILMMNVGFGGERILALDPYSIMRLFKAGNPRAVEELSINVKSSTVADDFEFRPLVSVDFAQMADTGILSQRTKALIALQNIFKKSTALGGIDLNPEKLNMRESGDHAAMFEALGRQLSNLDVLGMRPVIIHIKAVDPMSLFSSL